MDALTLAKIQFFITIGFHFIFPPITIGIGWFMVYFMTKYIRTKDLFYKNLTWFWIKIFTVTVAMGIPTGIFMEFQFGTNWAEFSRFVGDIFATPLTLEIFFAFFLESVFLGVIIQGWKSTKIPDKIIWLSTILVALGTTLSAFWILVANSWMHSPRGYGYSSDGEKLILSNIWEAVFNPTMLPRFWHTINACMIVGSFFVIGIGCIYLLKDRHSEYAKYSLRFALIVGVIASILQVFFGHWQSTVVYLNQPVKFAAQEGVFNTETGAPLIIFAILDETQLYFSLFIPGLLSILLGNPNTTVIGLNDIAIENRPPVILTFYSFHLMVILGGIFILFTLFGVILLWRKKLHNNSRLQKLFLRFGVVLMPLPIITNEFGWITTEVGRQPWIVQGVLRTADAVSVNVSAEEILFSVILFCLTFILLFTIWLLALTRIIKKGYPELIKEGGEVKN
ncbi:MAG: cytochrome ubiquinol oxidase subunit I [Candidatus Hodarchaeota archaeon]